MFKIGDAVYAFSVDIRKEEDWNTFMNITDWFVDEFMESKEWKMLRDSGLSVVIKRCVVSVKGYLGPNDAYTKNRG